MSNNECDYLVNLATLQNKWLSEGQTVSFNITTTPLIGSFGSTSSTTTSMTDEFGESRVYYNTPNNINDIGEDIPFSRYTADVMAETVTLTTNNLSIVNTYRIFLYFIFFIITI